MLVGGGLIDTSKGRKALPVSAVLLLSLAVSIVNEVRNYSEYGGGYTGIFDGHIRKPLWSPCIRKASKAVILFS